MSCIGTFTKVLRASTLMLNAVDWFLGLPSPSEWKDIAKSFFREKKS